MSQGRAAGAAVAVALLGSSARGEVVPDAVPGAEWVLGRVDASCQRVCSERSRICDEDAFPKSQEEFVLIFGSVVNTVNDMCDSVVTGDACYEPSYKDGGQCGWKVCPEMEGQMEGDVSEGDVSDSRCAAVPSSTSQRFCPCRRLDVWATLHMEKLHPDEMAGGAIASPIDAATTTTVPLLNVVRKAERSPDAEASPRQARSVQPFLYLPDNALSEAQPEATLTNVTSTTTGTADQAILGVGRIQLRMLKDGKNGTLASNATGSLNASVANFSKLTDLLNASVANLSTLLPGASLSDQDRNSSKNDSVKNHSSKAHWFSWKHTDSESNSSTKSNSSAKKLGSSAKKLGSSSNNNSAVASHSSTKDHSATANLSHEKKHSAESHSTKAHSSKDHSSENHSSKDHSLENNSSSNHSSDSSNTHAMKLGASQSSSSEADSKDAGADNNTAHGQSSNSTNPHSSNTTVNTTAATTNASPLASTNTTISLGNTSNHGNLRSLYPAPAETTTTTTTKPPVNGALVGGVVAGSVAATAGLLGGLLGGLLTTVTATTTTTLLITSTTLTSATSRPEEGVVDMATERALTLGSILGTGATNATGAQAQLGGVGWQLGGLGFWNVVAASTVLAMLVVTASVLAVRGRGSTTRSAMVEDGSEYEPSEMYDHEASPHTESPMQTLLSDQTMLHIGSPKERSFQNSHQNSAAAQQRLHSMRPRGLNYFRGLFNNGWSSPMEIQGGRPPKAAPRTTYATVPARVTHVERWDLAQIFSWFSRPPQPPPRSAATVQTRPSLPRGSFASVASATEPMAHSPTSWSPPRASYARPASPSSYARPASTSSYARPASPSSWHAQPSRPQRPPPRSQRFQFNSAPSWQQSRVTMFNP